MRARGLLALIAVLAVAGCGSSGGGLTAPTIGAARTFKLSDFMPSGPVKPRTPTTVSFVIRQPSGRPLTRFKTGPGPHTGVHLIMVRTDLGAIIHRHPPIAADGTISQTVSFPSGGRWHVLIDVYPNLPDSGPNFQLAGSIDVTGAYHPLPIGPFKATDSTGGYRFTIHSPPKIKALEPAFLNVTVTRPNGTRADFTPWYGALAHAIFFQKGTLNYFHTHVCAPGAAGCTSALGGAKVTGQSTTPGKLTVGVLLPVAGTWKLFLQTKVDGKVLTAPYTIKAS
jgi:hypothetical protein